MAINLEKKLQKGERINLSKESGAKLTQFCVGCNWGQIVSGGFLGMFKDKKTVDLDLSCVVFDQDGNLMDHIYSPLYKPEVLQKFGLPRGKLDTADMALHHSGDDLEGDADGDDGLDNEIITVDLNRVNPGVGEIYFFLNNCGKEDFSQIPYASIRMYEGTPSLVREVFASYDVAASPQYKGRTALIMGKLYRHNGEWRFAAIGDAFDDAFLGFTIHRIAKDYAKKK